jgi:acetyl esterase/lipase
VHFRFLLLAALLWALPVPAAGQVRGDMPETVDVVADVVCATAPDRAGQEIELTLDAAFPRQSGDRPLPAIVYIHGGGLRGGRKEAGRRLIAALAEGGYFSVSINDRLVPVEQGRLFAEALEAAGVTVVYVPVDGSGHDIAEPDAYRRIAAFFDAHIGGRAAEIKSLTTVRQRPRNG